MILSDVKEKLHEYIDHADASKIQAIYTLVASDIEDRSGFYDEETMNIIRSISSDYSSGKIKGYPMEESMERIRKKIGKREL